MVTCRNCKNLRVAFAVLQCNGDNIVGTHSQTVGVGTVVMCMQFSFVFPKCGREANQPGLNCFIMHFGALVCCGPVVLTVYQWQRQSIISRKEKSLMFAEKVALINRSLWIIKHYKETIKRRTHFPIVILGREWLVLTSSRPWERFFAQRSAKKADKFSHKLLSSTCNFIKISFGMISCVFPTEKRTNNSHRSDPHDFYKSVLPS